MQFLTIDQVAEILNLSAQGIRAEILSGNLKAIQVGGRKEWRIEEAWLEDYVKRAEVAATQKIQPQQNPTQLAQQ